MMRPAILGAASILLAVSAAAQPMNVKTGLWETTTTTQLTGLPQLSAMPQISPEMLAKMTPEQRAAIEKAMARAGNKTNTTKSCVTKEQLDKAMTFGDSKDQKCKRTLVNSTSTKQDIHLECSYGQITMAGDAHFEAVDSSTVKGNLTMNSTGQGAGGTQTTFKVDFSSKYLSADCGDLGKSK